MTRRKPRLLPFPGVIVLLTGCASIGGTGGAADAAIAAGPLSLQQQAAQVRANRVEILFPPRRFTLTSEDGRQLDMLARLIRDDDPVTLYTTAYESGSDDERAQRLWLRRAVAVKHGLMARGIPERQVRVRAVSLPGGAEAAEDKIMISWGAP